MAVNDSITAVVRRCTAVILSKIFAWVCQNPSWNDYAKQLLLCYVLEFKTLYGQRYMCPNVHNLLHLADACMKLGVLDNFSAFEFESFLGSLLLLIKKKTDYLSQIVKRITEKQNLESSTCIQESLLAELFESHCDGPLCNLSGLQYRSARYLDFCCSLGCRIFYGANYIHSRRMEAIGDSIVFALS